MDFEALLGFKNSSNSALILAYFFDRVNKTLRSYEKSSRNPKPSPKDTFRCPNWTPDLESRGPLDQELGTGTGAEDLTCRGPLARRIFGMEVGGVPGFAL